MFGRWLLLAGLGLLTTAGVALSQELLRFVPAEGVSGWVVRTVTQEGETREVVTDARIAIDAFQDNPEAILDEYNVIVPEPFRWIFGLGITVVAGGRILDEGYALCSPWAYNRSVCTIECDGGHFRLDRRLAQGEWVLVVVLMPMPDLIDGDTSAAIRIGECSEDGAVMLDTATGKTGALVFR